MQALIAPLGWFFLGMLFLPIVRDWLPKRGSDPVWEMILDGSWRKK